MTLVVPAGERRNFGSDSRGAAPRAVRVWLLGGYRVSVGARTIGEDEWRLRKAASLVKLLALAKGHRLHREVVMDLLWPSLGRRAARNNLRGALHTARRALDPTMATSSRYLHFADGELVLCPDVPLWVDADAFKVAAQTARRSHEPAAYRAAIELYAGELLPADRYEESEDYGSAIEEALRRLLSEEPILEGAHVDLMGLYALSGRRGESLRQYELLEVALRRELGVEPGFESRRLHEEILSGRFPPARPSAQERPSEESPGVGPLNLPTQRTSFVGRKREVVGLKWLLAMTGLVLQREMNDRVSVARTLLILGLTANARHDYELALELHEESLALAREVKDGFAIVLSLVVGTPLWAEATIIGRECSMKRV